MLFFLVGCSRVSDETGSMETTLVAEGTLDRGHLDTKDVFIVDTGKKLFVWIGNAASPDEKKNAMPYAHVSSACDVPLALWGGTTPLTD